jgi:ureidoacrylate peracid hydrolase
MRFRAPEQANEKAGEMTEDLRAALRKNLTPASAALIVIDVQNDFCAKGGYFDRTGADLSLVEPAVTRMLGLIDAARAAGVMVTFVRSHYDPVYLSEAQNARRRRVGWDIPLCRQGTWGVEFYRVAPKPGETIIIKHRYDAFHQTDLELVLRTNAITSLILTGVATNVCVESTLRAAFMRDFEVCWSTIAPRPAIAARTRRRSRMCGPTSGWLRPPTRSNRSGGRLPSRCAPQRARCDTQNNKRNTRKSC